MSALCMTEPPIGTGTEQEFDEERADDREQREAEDKADLSIEPIHRYAPAIQRRQPFLARAAGKTPFELKTARHRLERSRPYEHDADRPERPIHHIARAPA